MTWISKEAWMLGLGKKDYNILKDTKIKSPEEILNDNFFYKFGELFRSLVGTQFMCYEDDKLITKTIKEIKFKADVVFDEERKKYVENKNKFVALHELSLIHI